MRFSPFIALLAGALALQAEVARAAEPSCPTADQPIETDRPDITNSSIVVPAGSLQSENGADLSGQSSGQGGGHTVTGPQSRLRFGLAPCLEVLVDLPNYSAFSGNR